MIGLFLLAMDTNEFPIEYVYQALSDSDERFARAWELILALILENYIEERSNSDGEA